MGLEDFVFRVAKRAHNEYKYMGEWWKYSDCLGYNGTIRGTIEYYNLGDIPIYRVGKNISEEIGHGGVKEMKKLIDEAAAACKEGYYTPTNEKEIEEFIVRDYTKRHLHKPNERNIKSMIGHFNYFTNNIIRILTTACCINSAGERFFRIPENWKFINGILLGLSGEEHNRLKIYGEGVGSGACEKARYLDIEIEKTGSGFLNNAFKCMANIKKLGALSGWHTSETLFIIDEAEDGAPVGLNDSKVKAKKLGREAGSYSNNSELIVEEAGDDFLLHAQQSKGKAEKSRNSAGHGALLCEIEVEETGDEFLKKAYHSRGLAKKLGLYAGKDARNCIINSEYYGRVFSESYHFLDFLKFYSGYVGGADRTPEDWEVLRELPCLGKEFLNRLLIESDSGSYDKYGLKENMGEARSCINEIRKMDPFAYPDSLQLVAGAKW